MKIWQIWNFLEFWRMGQFLDEKSFVCIYIYIYIYIYKLIKKIGCIYILATYKNLAMWNFGGVEFGKLELGSFFFQEFFLIYR
jgi:hypothetical protein